MTMTRTIRTMDIDNHNTDDVIQYQEARIEALRNRIQQLETENRDLTLRLLEDSWKKGTVIYDGQHK